MPSLNKTEHYVFLSLLGIMRVVTRTTRQKVFHKDESFLSLTFAAQYKHQIKFKILFERQRLFSLEFGKGCTLLSRERYEFRILFGNYKLRLVWVLEYICLSAQFLFDFIFCP